VRGFEDGYAGDDAGNRQCKHDCYANCHAERILSERIEISIAA
jgi:hypothetical protein